MTEETKESFNCEQDMTLNGDNTGNYTWIINEKSLIEKILNAKNGDMFESEPFIMSRLEWMIQLYPNGGNNASKGSVMIRLRLLSSSIISMIQLICSILCNKTMSCSTYEAMLTTECGWIPRVLLLKEWKQLNLHQLSISVSIKILKIILNKHEYHNNLLLSQLKINSIINHNDCNDNDTKRNTLFTYKLSKNMIDAFNESYYGKRFESAIFDNMWRLVIYPKHWAKNKESQMYIGLHLCCAPIYAQGVTAKYSIICKQNNKKSGKTADFTYKSPTSGSGKYINLTDIIYLKCVTFIVNVEILKIIYYHHDNDNDNDDYHIWESQQINYILSTQISRYNKMEKEMESLRYKIEEKDAAIKSLKDELIKQTEIMQLLCNRMNIIENEKETSYNHNINHNNTLILIDKLIKQIETL